MRPSVALKSLTVPHEFLESALSLYFEHKAYSSALHLAGAAEELLGKLLRENGVESWLDSIQQLCMDAWDKVVSEAPVSTIDGARMSLKSIAADLNSARNHVKHFTAAATYDVRVESCRMLWRAFSNYDRLRQTGASLSIVSELTDRLLASDIRTFG